MAEGTRVWVMDYRQQASEAPNLDVVTVRFYVRHGDHSLCEKLLATKSAAIINVIDPDEEDLAALKRALNEAAGGP